MTFAIVLSCEHAGHDVPAPYAEAFHGADALLASHRGWDPGTLELGRALASALGVPLIATTVTRLLADTNRSPGHRQCFSELVEPLGEAAKAEILARYHRPHRQRVIDAVAAALETSRVVVHLGIHSFTPCLDGDERRFDVGWLYDSRRAAERRMADRWREALAERRPDWRQRRNAPYLGSADGLTTTLRRHFPAERYLGLELEVNQKHPLGPASAWQRAIGDLVEAIGVGFDRVRQRAALG